MKVWIARDKNGELNMFSCKPYRNENGYWSFDHSNAKDDEIIFEDVKVEMNAKLCPEIQWYESPVEAEINIKQK